MTALPAFALKRSIVICLPIVYVFNFFVNTSAGLSAVPTFTACGAFF